MSHFEELEEQSVNFESAVAEELAELRKKQRGFRRFLGDMFFEA